MSVKIVDYKLRTSESGKAFFTLSLQGGVEIVQSSSGKQYVTARKANMPTTFDEMTCQTLIGQELPGTIQKVVCDPYEYTVQDTGEIITLNHRYEYTQEDAPAVQQGLSTIYVSSQDGMHSRVM